MTGKHPARTEDAAHGGDVWKAAAATDISVEDLLDFSANVNPEGLPVAALERLQQDAQDLRLLSWYPDRDATALTEQLAAYYQVPPSCIAIAEGAEALIGYALQAFGHGHCIVPVPAFSEYRRRLHAAKVEMSAFLLKAANQFRLPVERFCQEMASGEFQSVIVNNPHNPSGALLSRRSMVRLLDAARLHGVFALIDEAFIDFVPSASCVSHAIREPGVLVLRSLTKFFGCPALRVGCAVGHPAMIRRLKEGIPTWPVTTLAMNALTEALADTSYHRRTLQQTHQRRRSLRASLQKLGCTVYPGTANYLLLRLPATAPSAAEVRERLLRNAQILIRSCDSYEGLEPGRFIRVAVRRSPENRKLVDALRRLFAQSVRPERK